MKTFRLFFSIAHLLLGVWLIAACSGGSSSPATTAPTVGIPATAANLSTTAAPATATSQPAETGAPATDTPTATIAAPSAVPVATSTTAGAASTSPLAAAVAQVGTAPSLRLHNAITGDADLMSAFYGMPTNPAAASTVVDDEFEGKNSRSVGTGVLALLMTGGTAPKFESAIFDGKNYVHGPIPLLQAADNKWYQLGPGMTITHPAELLAKIGTVSGGWDAWTKSATGQTLDGQNCDVYTATSDAASKAFHDYLNGITVPGAPTVDGGNMSAVVCPDGYLHDISYTLKVHQGAKTGEVQFDLHLWDFGNVKLTPPADAVMLPTPSSSLAIPTRGPAGANDGHWQGKTAGNAAIHSVEFRVDQDYISDVLIFLNGTDSCNYRGGFGQGFLKEAPVNDNSFTAKFTDHKNVEYSLIGKFDSNGTASGTIDVKGMCGNENAQDTWTATLQSDDSGTSPTPVAGAKPTIAPESAPTRAATSGDAVSTVKSFFSAVNEKNYDDALNYVSDNLIYTIGTTSDFGKDGLKAYLANHPVTFTLSNFDAVGDSIVNFTAQSSDGTTFKRAGVILTNGEITILNLR